MQLKNYKYINNQKPKFDQAIGAEGQPNTNQQFTGMPIKSSYDIFAQNSTLDSKFRTPVTQNIRPTIPGTTPVTSKGVTDLNPAAGGSMSGAKGASTATTGAAGGTGAAGASGASSGGFANTGAAYGQAITSSLQAGFAINDAWNQPAKSEGGLLGDAGTSQGQVGGVQYQRQNNIDAAGEIAEEKARANKQLQNVTMATSGAGVATGLAIGATIGGAAGPIGAGIGAVVGTVAGLFVGGAAKKRALHKINKRIANAQVKVGTINSYGRSVAQTTQLQQEYAQDSGDTQGQVLYANKGKDMKPKFNSGKNNKVYSADGYKAGEHNSWVGKGESIYNPAQGLATYIDRGTVGVDNQKSSVRENDDNVIFGNDIDMQTGTTFAKQAAPYSQKLHFINEQEKKVGKYGQLSSLTQKTKELYDKQMQPQKQQLTEQMNAIAERQRKQHEFENNMKQRTRFANGKSNFWGNTKNFLGGAYDFASDNADGIMGYFQNRARQREAEREEINPSNTYFRNVAAGEALAGMAGLRYDPRPQLSDLRSRLGFNKYNIDQTGGLTAGQKLIARNSLYNDYVNNAAKIYATAEEQNNAYKNQYYNALLKQGTEDRNAITEAARYDDSIYRKAQAAKRQYLDQIIKDQQEVFNRIQKRRVDNQRWKDTMSIYQADQDNKKADIDWRRNHANTLVNSTGSTPTTSTGNTPTWNPFGINYSWYKPSTSAFDSLQWNPYINKFAGWRSMIGG